MARDGERVAELVAVAGSDDGKDSLSVGGLNGVGPGGGGSAAEGQVDNRASGAALGCDVVDRPVEARENVGGGTSSALEDLDGDQVGTLGDTVG